jgi:2-methylcitrate dehydratase
MSAPGEAGDDRIQQRLVDYALELDFDALPPEAVHAAKLRVIDTLGALMRGFSAEPCSIARRVAARTPDANGSTLIGTQAKVAADVAAFANATAARYVNFTDTYNWPKSAGGHPSDVIAPVLAVAELKRRTGREFITGVVLAYEVFLRLSDVFQHPGFDYTSFGTLGAAVGAAKILGLSRSQLAECIAMAAASGNMLRQTRLGQLTMWKAAASGQAARTGVFAAFLAQDGMEGPRVPFEGKAGWCDHVAGQRFALDAMGGGETPFKVTTSVIKARPAVGLTIASILAAESIAPLADIGAVKAVTVEVYKRAKQACGSGAHHWSPDSAETADHSIPYLVATTLIEGTVTPSSYDERHLRNADLRALMQKIDVVENEGFTTLYQQVPVEQCARVTATFHNGEHRQGEVRYGAERPTSAEMERRVADKFRGLTEGILPVATVDSILDCLLHLDGLEDVAAIPPLFVIA